MEGYWTPQNIEEWNAVQETSVFLKAWATQQDEERSLRSMLCVWVFILITAQIVGIFTLVVISPAFVSLDEGLVKILIPSILAEVFGMGFIVVKYLFRPSSLDPWGRRKGEGRGI